MKCSSDAQHEKKWTCKAPGCTVSGDESLFQMWRNDIQKRKNNKDRKPDRANGRQKCNKCFSEWSSDAHQRQLRIVDVAKNIMKS